MLFRKPLTTGTFFFRDLYLLFYPKKLFFAESLRAGHMPLWDPFTNGGQPYLVNPANTALHPSNVLYLVLDPLTAFNWILVLHFVFAAIAAYWLARSIGLSQPAAFASGAIFSLCGYTLSTANLMPLLFGLPWIPTTIALLHRALAQKRSLVPAAISAAMPLFCAAAEMEAMLFATIVVWIAFTPYDLTRRAKAVAASIVIVFAVGLSLVATLPATAVIEQSARSGKRSYDAFTTWSVHPLRLGELVVPHAFGPTNTLNDADYWGRNFESEGFPYILSIYFGIPALLLAAAGARRRPALAVLALAGIVLALGKYLPGFRLVYELPLVATFRFPIKAVIAAILPIALLAGFGLETFLDRRRISWVIAGLCAIGVGIAAMKNPPLALCFVHAMLAAIGVAIAVRNEKWRAPALAAIVACDLAVASIGVNTFGPRELFDRPPLADAVSQAIDGERFWSPKRDIVLDAPTNDIYWLARWQLATLNEYCAGTFGIPVIFHVDYDGLAPKRIGALEAIVAALPPDRQQPILDRADVRVFATMADQKVQLHRNPTAAAARFVSSVERVSGEGEAAKRLLRKPTALILESAPASVANCGEAPVVVQRVSDEKVRYQVDAPCDGYVAFADTKYNGWTALVDGQLVDIVPADYAFSAVPVKAGRHAIEREYRPQRLMAGAAGSLIALVLLYIANWAASRICFTRAMN
ncbi:MAG: YfhO family protein [Acidobacteria bacterium]|nr:YfhO family protein [Acidobacteriota bacterium]